MFFLSVSLMVPFVQLHFAHCVIPCHSCSLGCCYSVVARAVESESRTWSRSRKDFQLEEFQSQKILTTPTPGRPFAHQMWVFVPQTCVSVTLGNLSSFTLQQEMIMAMQAGGSALTCIPSLRGQSRSAASLGLITQPTLCECNRSGLVSLKLPFAHSRWHYRWSVTLAKHDDCLIANDNPDLWFLVILLLLVRNDLIQLVEDNTADSLGLLHTVANFFKTLNRQISFLKQTNIP